MFNGCRKCNGSELLNAAPIKHITWPMSVSIHDSTLKGGKIHCYNDICEIAKRLISPSSSSSSSFNFSNGLAQIGTRIYCDILAFPCG